jgi:hypothetical protein
LSDRKLKLSDFPRRISPAGEQGEWVKGEVIGEIFKKEVEGNSFEQSKFCLTPREAV